MNAFTLTSAFSLFRGIYLHPITARFNHSCDANAYYSFAYGKIYVTAIRDIEKDEQIFVPYTDCTFSVGTRRRDLLERFKFQCNCTKCLDETKTLSATEIEQRASEEQQVNQALEKINKKARRDRTKSAAEADRELNDLMRQTAAKRDWPTVRRQAQPLETIRTDLMSSQRSTGKLYDMVLSAAIQHLRSDPVLYPDPHHPVRRDHAMGFMQYIYYALADPGGPDRKHVLMRKHVNLGVILESLANWLVRGDYGIIKNEGGELIIWPNPTVQTEAWRAAGIIRMERLKRGVPRDDQMGEFIESSWAKLERIVDRTLRREMGGEIDDETDEDEEDDDDEDGLE